MNVLDILSPERFVVELPFLLETLAIEFAEVRITISPENLPLLVEDLRLGLNQRPRREVGEFAAYLTQLQNRSSQGQPAELHMSRGAACAFARDLAKGTLLRQRGGKAGANAAVD